MITSIGFAPDLIPLISKGEKTYTYRLGDKYEALKIGDNISFRDSSKNKDIGIIKITEISHMPFKDLPIDRKGHEKYASKEIQRAIFKKYYGRDINDDEPVLILGFRLISE